MSETVTIFSTRTKGYVLGGHRFGRTPQTYAVIENLPEESQEESVSRKGKRVLTRVEVSQVHTLIQRADAADIEPALGLVAVGVEEGEQRRRIDVGRIALQEQHRLLRDVETRISSVQAEIGALTALEDEKSKSLVAMDDRLSAASKQLEEKEQALGTIDTQAKTIARLQAAAVKAGRGD